MLIRKHDRTSRSIFQKIFFPVFFLLILQSIILFSIIYYGGILDKLRSNSYDILTEQVINRKNELETTINMNWTDLDSTVSDLLSSYRSCPSLDDSKDSDAYLEGKKTYLKMIAPTLIRTLRQNEVNGVFVIFNESRTYNDVHGAESQVHDGLCIRDLDQSASYTDKEDLILERCPASLIADVGCNLDSWWEANYTFTSDMNNDYFYRPLKAAYENPDSNYDDLSYFCGPHHVSENDTEMVSYSVPLMNSDGYPFAVLGIEISTKYLATQIPFNELGDDIPSSYILAQTVEGSDQYTVCAYNGIFYKKSFGEQTVLTRTTQLSDSCYEFQGTSSQSIMGSLQPLSVYNKNTPYEKEQLVLIELTDKEAFLRFSTSLRNTLFLAALISLFIGIIGVIIICKQLSYPIQNLSRKVEQMRTDNHSAASTAVPSEQDFKLDKIGISEIDRLTDSIEQLNRTVSMNRAKSEFFSRMSHDMRTPMNAIIGFSNPEMIDATDEAQKLEYLNKINTSGKYLLQLINEILDISKIESKKLDIQYEPTQLKHVLDIVLPIIQEIADKKQIHFIYNCDDRLLSLTAMLDEQRLRQIFVNLLSNAVKYTPEQGTVELQITCLSLDSSSVSQKIIIRDNGQGMSKEFQAKLFQEFEQEHPGQEGSGLGLSIAKSLVALMNGKIEYTSAPNKGTTFTVYLTSQLCVSPAEEHTIPSEERPSYRTEDLDSILAGRHFLLCEDHPLNTQIAVKLLEKKGITCDCAPNGKKGVELFLDSTPFTYDAILMDIRMPEMDGLSATRVIRSLSREDSSSIPIIAMTANAFAEDVKACLQAGMNTHLSKPIAPALLYQTLAEQLSTLPPRQP